MQKIFYMNSIIRENKLGHKMLTGIKEMKYTCSSFIQPPCVYSELKLVTVSTETQTFSLESKCLAAQCFASPLGSLRRYRGHCLPLWPLSAAQPCHAQICLSALRLLLHNVLLGTQRNKSMYPWGILFQPRESLLPRGVSIIPFQSLSEKCNTVPLGFKMLPVLGWVLRRFINNSWCNVYHF